MFFSRVFWKEWGFGGPISLVNACARCAHRQDDQLLQLPAVLQLHSPRNRRDYFFGWPLVHHTLSTRYLMSSLHHSYLCCSFSCIAEHVELYFLTLGVLPAYDRGTKEDSYTIFSIVCAGALLVAFLL